MAKFNFSRREFLILSGSAIAASAIGVSCDSENNVPTELMQPEIRQSFAGTLETQLNVDFAPNRITGIDGGQRVFTRTYEGTIPGPTLRVNPGDTMNITLNNGLPPNTDPLPVNMLMPHGINTTNLHTHGLHVSPSGNQDNALLRIFPSETFNYSIQIPQNHWGGTFWYHPHKHGSVTTQMQGGMSGTIIIEGAIDQVPEIAAARDITLVFQELQLSSNNEVEDPDTTATGIGDVYPSDKTLYTVNGQINPILKAKPGEVIRLRTVNATIGTFYPLALDDHNLYLIANDGISLSEVSEQSEVFIGPGNRADILIKAQAPGTYILRGLEYERSDSLERDEVDLLTFVVEGPEMNMNLPQDLPAPFAPITDEEITGSRELIFDTVDNTGQFPSGYTVTTAFTIDGELYNEDEIDQTIQLGAVEEWTLVNNATEDHNFHIHTNPFEVVAIDGEELETPVWYDTILLPRDGGTVTIRSRFVDFTGAFVLHCHILDHEDLGMMQNVEIIA